MPSGLVDVHTGATDYVAPRGPHLHKNPGQVGDEHLFMPALSLEGGVHAIWMYHSADYGETWSRTAFVTDAQISVDTQDWVALDWDVEGSICHLVFMEDSGGTGNVYYAGFNMDTIAVETAPEAVHTGFSTSGSNDALHTTLAARDGTTVAGNGVVVQYLGPEFRSMGTGYETVWYGYKSGGTWTTGQLSPSSVTTIWQPYATIRGSLGNAHITYIERSGTFSANFYSRSLTSANALGAQQLNGAIGEIYTEHRHRQSRMLHYTQDDGGVRYAIHGDWTSNQDIHSDRYEEVGEDLDFIGAMKIDTIDGDPLAVSARHDTNQLWALYPIGSPYALRGWYSDDDAASWNSAGVLEDPIPSFHEFSSSSKTYQRADTNSIVLGYVFSGAILQFGDYVVASVGGVVDIGTIAEVNTLRSFEYFSIPNRVVVCGYGNDEFLDDPREVHIWLATDDTLTNWERRGPTQDPSFKPDALVFSPERDEYVMLDSASNYTYVSTTKGKGWTQYPAQYSNGWDIVWIPELSLYLGDTFDGPSRSPDGINWTKTGLNIGHSVDWSPDLGLALEGGNGGIWTSPDLINWTQRLSLPSDEAVQDSAWSPELGIWVATGSDGSRVWYSYDGITWTEADTSPHSLDGNARACAWSADLGLFMAGWVEDPNNNNVYDTYLITSTDGINWTKHLIFTGADWGTNGGAVYDDPGLIRFNHGEWIPESQKFLVTTHEGGVWTSPDALNWSRDLVLSTYERSGGSGIQTHGIGFVPDPTKTGLIGTIAEVDSMIPIEVVTPLQTVNIGTIAEIDALIDAEPQAGSGFAGWGIPI